MNSENTSEIRLAKKTSNRPNPSLRSRRTLDSWERPAVRIRPVPRAATRALIWGFVIFVARLVHFSLFEIIERYTFVDHRVLGVSNSFLIKSPRTAISFAGLSGNYTSGSRQRLNLLGPKRHVRDPAYQYHNSCTRRSHPPGVHATHLTGVRGERGAQAAGACKGS
jgi:hypothetical protein